ncbi:forkhead box protein M1 isoform X1 [Nothoprocta perdicaria]|uniref:forkhead box protein M1 isoform X1 n=1 Tax=Nothoprocta perdicaria TaxID=30464 RepID=UPI000E1C245E|nr:forkhead box protein M1 isoform X1 [Nothoprocta perdicaria]
MRTSPRRPLILKRRKLTLPQKDAPSASARDEPGGQGKKTPKQEHSQRDQLGNQPRLRADCGLQKFPAGIKIINHPTMPNTQVVAIPTSADIQSIIEALTAKGKESGSNGPNKFILISSGGSSHAAEPAPLQHLPSQAKARTAPGEAERWDREKHVMQGAGFAAGTMLLHSGIDPMVGQEQEGNGSSEATSPVLDNSLTNIQWLGKMRSDGLSPCPVKQEREKENRTPLQERTKDSVSERPPYSYMAMIQFAINSTEKKRMTLKDIYTWIEDHFPYFKHVAKPGWKNSIRHNLSLHDMFVRETSANGKISFWTIHPDANRCLTLDQVFKPLDLGSPTSPEHSESQQKRHVQDLQKNMGSSSSKTEPHNARRKMKPLLPRINSYLVPIQFPLSQPLVLQPSMKVPLSMAQGTSLNSAESVRSNKRVRIAPKMCLSAEESSSVPMTAVKEESQCDESLFAPALSLKESSSQPGEESVPFPEALCVKEEQGSQPDDSLSPFPSALPVKEEPSSFLPGSATKQKKHFTLLKSPSKGVSDTLVIKRRERREAGRSRRKQRLALPCSEEPLLVLPEGSDYSTFRLGADVPFLQESQALENVSQFSCSQEEEGPFKTPVKELFSKLPVSSTPSKVPATTPPLGCLDPWKPASLAKESNELDFSPVRTFQLSFTPLRENQDLLGFNSTPPKNPLFESPRELLNTESSEMMPGPLTSSPSFIHESTKQSSVELPASGLTENRSLMEGLILDTMNDSLSKILLDISFPGLEDENLGTDISWSQLIPELK